MFIDSLDYLFCEFSKFLFSDVTPSLTIWKGGFLDVILALYNFVIRRPFWQLFGDLYGGATDIVNSKQNGIHSVQKNQSHKVNIVVCDDFSLSHCHKRLRLSLIAKSVEIYKDFIQSIK